MNSINSQNEFREFARVFALVLGLAVTIVVCLAMENEYKQALQLMAKERSQLILLASYDHLSGSSPCFGHSAKSKLMSLVQQQAVCNCQQLAQKLDVKLLPAMGRSHEYGGLSYFSGGDYLGREFDEGFSEFFPYSYPPFLKIGDLMVEARFYFLRRFFS